MNGGLLTGRHVDGEVRMQRVIVKKERFHVLGFVAQCEDEIGVFVMGINAHDVPKHGVSTDWHHRLRDIIRIFGEPGAEAAGEDDSFHKECSVCMVVS